MEIKSGRKIALAVDSNWYQILAGHRFFKNSQPAEHPTNMFAATIEDLSGSNGIWVKPDARFSDFPEGLLFVPWRFIVAAVVLGPDDERKLGFP